MINQTNSFTILLSRSERILTFTPFILNILIWPFSWNIWKPFSMCSGGSHKNVGKKWRLILTFARFPFLAASSNAASPLSKSITSGNVSFTKSNGVCPSWFFFAGSAPCYHDEFRFSLKALFMTFLHLILEVIFSPVILGNKLWKLKIHWNFGLSEALLNMNENFPNLHRLFQKRTTT